MLFRQIISTSIFTILIGICNGQQNQATDFDTYLQSFPLLKLSYSIDSTMLYKLDQQEDISQPITNIEQFFFNIPDFNYYCDSFPRYVIYKLGLLELPVDSIRYLIYYVSKHKECSYDIRECYVVIGKYSNKKLIKYQIIGRLVEFFGESVYQYSLINFNLERNRLSIQEEFIQEQLDDINPDILHLTKNTKTYEW